MSLMSDEQRQRMFEDFQRQMAQMSPEQREQMIQQEREREAAMRVENPPDPRNELDQQRQQQQSPFMPRGGAFDPFLSNEHRVPLQMDMSPTKPGGESLESAQQRLQGMTPPGAPPQGQGGWGQAIGQGVGQAVGAMRGPQPQWGPQWGQGLMGAGTASLGAFGRPPGSGGFGRALAGGIGGLFGGGGGGKAIGGGATPASSSYGPLYPFSKRPG